MVKNLTVRLVSFSCDISMTDTISTFNTYAEISITFCG